jgi:hypothetical protein
MTALGTPVASAQDWAEAGPSRPAALADLDAVLAKALPDLSALSDDSP